MFKETEICNSTAKSNHLYKLLDSKHLNIVPSSYYLPGVKLLISFFLFFFFWSWWRSHRAYHYYCRCSRIFTPQICSRLRFRETLKYKLYSSPPVPAFFFFFFFQSTVMKWKSHRSICLTDWLVHTRYIIHRNPSPLRLLQTRAERGRGDRSGWDDQLISEL